MFRRKRRRVVVPEGAMEPQWDEYGWLIVPQYVAPWGNDGDHSVWMGTLVPWYGPDHFVWPGWRHAPEHAGLLGVRRWVMCVSGRSLDGGGPPNTAPPA